MVLFVLYYSAILAQKVGLVSSSALIASEVSVSYDGIAICDGGELELSELVSEGSGAPDQD